jgi:hypothetical protein
MKCILENFYCMLAFFSKIGNVYCSFFNMTLSLLLIPLLTCLINIKLSLMQGILPYFPIELSNIANNSPQYYIFLFGMSWTAWLLFRLPYNIRGDILIDLFRMIASICLFGLALFSDKPYFWTHILFASGFFYSTMMCFYLNNFGSTHSLILKGVLVTLVIRFVLGVTHLWIYALPIPLLQIRALCQFINIGLLLYGFQMPDFY